MNQEELKSRIEVLKALRKAVQLAMSAMELDADDIAGISSMVDPWQSGAKYKKGMLASENSAVYRCTANVNKSAIPPSEDADHWQRADLAGDGVEVWTAPTGKGYQKGDRVHYPDSEGAIYVSQKNNNTVEPGTDEKYWMAE